MCRDDTGGTTPTACNPDADRSLRALWRQVVSLKKVRGGSRGWCRLGFRLSGYRFRVSAQDVIFCHANLNHRRRPFRLTSISAGHSAPVPWTSGIGMASLAARGGALAAPTKRGASCARAVNVNASGGSRVPAAPARGGGVSGWVGRQPRGARGAAVEPRGGEGWRRRPTLVGVHFKHARRVSPSANPRSTSETASCDVAWQPLYPIPGPAPGKVARRRRQCR